MGLLRSLLIIKCFKISSLIKDSRILQIMEVKEIGIWLDRLVRLPFLKIGLVSTRQLFYHGVIIHEK